MANNTIKGLTVEIGGDTTKLGKALEGVNKKSRDLSQELGEINKLLKLDPKNTDLLQQKQKVLAEAVANTASKLEKLKEAEKQVQKQFEKGEVSEEQVRALQREIIATEKKMGGYEKAIKDTTYQLNHHGKTADEAREKTQKFGDTVKAVGSAAAKGIAVAATAAAAAAGALAAMATNAAAYADNILTASTVTGISTEKLQEYTYAAELVDVSVDTITKSHAKQIKSMKAVQDGTKLAVDAYQKLGVEVMNADGTLRDGETVYWEVIDALGKMENETERDALAMQILGKSAQELNPLIEAGSEKMAELAQEAHEVGAVLSTEALNSFGAFDDSIQRLKGSAGAAKNALGTVLLPELTALTTGGAELLAEFTKNLNEAGGGMEGFVVTIDNMSGEIGEKAGNLLGGIVDRASALMPAIVNVGVSLVTSVATSVVQKLPDLVRGITDTLIKSTPQLIKGATTLLLSIVDAVDRILPPLIEAAPDIVMTIVNGLLDAMPQLLDGALKLLLCICDAVPLLVDKLVPLIPTIVIAVTTALLNAAPQIVKAGFTLLSALSKAVPQAVQSLRNALPQIWQALSSYLKQLPSKVIAIGKEIVAGLWQGISDRYTWLKNKITGWVGNVTKFLKKLFGINSPSKVTAYMGEMLDEGLAVGIEDNAEAPERAMNEVSADVINAAGHVDGVAIERQISHTYSVNAAETVAQNAGMLSKLDAILKAIERGQIITLDGNALVGGTANMMNNALGQRRILAGRGAV